MNNYKFYFSSIDIHEKNLQHHGMIMYGEWLAINCISIRFATDKYVWYYIKGEKSITHQEAFDMWCDENSEAYKRGQGL